MRNIQAEMIYLNINWLHLTRTSSSRIQHSSVILISAYNVVVLQIVPAQKLILGVHTNFFKMQPHKFNILRFNKETALPIVAQLAIVEIVQSREKFLMCPFHFYE